MSRLRLIGYLRVSTDGQVKDGLGLDVQEHDIRAWIHRHEPLYSLVRIISENGRSGVLDDSQRPGLAEALHALRTHEADGLLLTSLDRLARVLTVQEAILAKVWTAGGRVFTVDQGLISPDDPNDPMRTAMRQMSGVFAQLDKSLIVKRLKAGRDTKAARGGHAVGKPPYGYRAHNRELVPDPTEQLVLARIHQLRSEGRSLRQIVDALTAEGHKPRSGRVWHPTTLNQILSRDTPQTPDE